MFLVEAYIIPTPSMEGSLLVGDFLFVSKASYGIRTPQTVAMFPLLHNTIPKLGVESYFKNPSLPYYRLPKFGDVEINDPIVFNWPAGDSVYLTPSRSWSAYQATLPNNLAGDPGLRNEIAAGDLRVRPVDKRDHYIKRNMALPGDSLEIIDGQVYVNGEANPNPPHMQFNYSIVDPTNSFSISQLDKYGIDRNDINGNTIALDAEQVAIIQEQFPNVQVEKLRTGPRPKTLFPNDPKNFSTWTIDNFGPIYIPKKGETVVITPKNIALYKRIISAYEGHSLSQKNGRIYVDGEVATKYTFEQDYYWAMGDNRHASEDSRFWGFVPFDHMVGKPIFIWMSLKNGSLGEGIRWNRIFSSADPY
jgi:signal peptidase I